MKTYVLCGVWVHLCGVVWRMAAMDLDHSGSESESDNASSHPSTPSSTKQVDDDEIHFLYDCSAIACEQLQVLLATGLRGL